MKYTIEHIKLLLNNQFDFIPKCLGVELVELGFLKYKKLTPENYYYWWYEVSDLTKINKNVYTYDWKDIELTDKCDWLKKLINYHEDTESMYNIITPILNLESAKNSFNKEYGKLDSDIIMELFYGHRTKKLKQMQLPLNYI